MDVRDTGCGMTTPNLTLTHMLRTLETRLLDPGFRTQRAAVEELLTPEFREIGPSGAAYTREAILDLLAGESPTAAATLEEFHAVPLGTEAALATYVSVADGRRTHRSSVWVYRRGNWRLLHHQGTPAA